MSIHAVERLRRQPAAAAPYEVLRLWVHQFADFLVTKHGLAEPLHSDQGGFEALHNEFVERLLPVLDQLLKASASAGRTRADVRAYGFVLGIGNLCIGGSTECATARLRGGYRTLALAGQQVIS